MIEQKWNELGFATMHDTPGSSCYSKDVCGCQIAVTGMNDHDGAIPAEHGPYRIFIMPPNGCDESVMVDVYPNHKDEGVTDKLIRCITDAIQQSMISSEVNLLIELHPKT